MRSRVRVNSELARGRDKRAILQSATGLPWQPRDFKVSLFLSGLSLRSKVAVLFLFSSAASTARWCFGKYFFGFYSSRCRVFALSARRSIVRDFGPNEWSLTSPLRSLAYACHCGYLSGQTGDEEEEEA